MFSWESFVIGVNVGTIVISGIIWIGLKIQATRFKAKYQLYDAHMARGNSYYETAQYYHAMGMTKESQECLKAAEAHFVEAAKVVKAIK